MFFRCTVCGCAFPVLLTPNNFIGTLLPYFYMEPGAEAFIYIIFIIKFCVEKKWIYLEHL